MADYLHYTVEENYGTGLMAYFSKREKGKRHKGRLTGLLIDALSQNDLLYNSLS